MAWGKMEAGFYSEKLSMLRELRMLVEETGNIIVSGEPEQLDALVQRRSRLLRGLKALEEKMAAMSTREEPPAQLVELMREIFAMDEQNRRRLEEKRDEMISWMAQIRQQVSVRRHYVTGGEVSGKGAFFDKKK